MKLRSSFVHVASVLCLLLAFPNEVIALGTIFGSTMNSCDTATFTKLKNCLVTNGVSADRIVPRPGLAPNQSSPSPFSVPIQYETLNDQCFLQGGQIEPLAYLIPKSMQDVQIGVKCCTHLGIHVVPKSGGHSFLKYSYGDSKSLIIDLRHMRQVAVNHEEATVEIGPGALLAHIWHSLWRETGSQFTIPLGIYATVGISGLALGGGHGHLARLYGLTLDSLVEMDMVNYQGNVLTANRQSNPDLFWALRGAGGGSFGFVTRFKFRLSLAPRRVVHAVRVYDFKWFAQFYKAWQQLFDNGPPNSINSFVRIAGRIKMDLFDMQLEMTSVSGGTSLIEAILAQFPPNYNDSVSHVKCMPYDEYLLLNVQSQGFAVSNMEDLAQITSECNSKSSYKVKSLYVYKYIDSSAIWELYQLLEHVKDGVNLFMEPYGGAINAIGTEETSFVHRGPNLLYCMQVYVAGKNETLPVESLKALRYFYEESKAILGHNESYQNYLDDDLQDDYMDRYYGNKASKKLAAVKQRFDPFNVFYNKQSIRSESEIG